MALDPDIVSAVTNAAGNVPANGQIAAANSGNGMTDAIDKAQAVAAYGDATSQVNYLQGTDRATQQAAWKSATTAQQQLWVGAGYKDPTGGSRNWFSRAVHDVFGAPSAVANEVTKLPVVGDAIGTVGDAAAQVGGDTLNALGSGVRYTQHAFRAGEYQVLTHAGDNAASNNPLTRVAGGVLGGAIELVAGPVDHYLLNQNHDSWADAWEKTTNGEQTFDPNKDRQIQQNSGLTDDQLTLAKAAAGGDQYLTNYFKGLKDAGMSDEDIVNIENQLNDPSGQFQKAVQQYKEAKLSIGRALVPSFLYKSSAGTAAANILSGAGDAAFDFFADPTLVGGKAVKAAKIARYGYKVPEQIGALLDKPAAAAWIKDVSSYLAKDDYAGLNQRYPQLIGINDALKDQNIKTADDLRAAMIPTTKSEQIAAGQEQEAAKAKLQSLQDQLPVDQDGNHIIEPGSEVEGVIKDALNTVDLANQKSEAAVRDWMQNNIIANHILTGHGSAVNHGTQIVPTLTPVGKALLDAKQVGKKVIDWAADKPVVDVGEDGAETINKTKVSGAISFLGHTARKALNLLPDGQTIYPTDPKANLAIQRFSNFYLSDQAAKILQNRWVQAGNDIGAKRNVYMDLLANTFKAAGIDESSDVYNHYIGTMENAIRTQVYSAGGNDAVKVDDGLASTAGMLDQHLTSQWSLPSFRDLAADQQRSKFMSMVYGATNNRAVDLFSNIWKPAQLLRVGFPIRVAMEELGGTIAREGPVNVAKSWLAARRLRQAGQGVAEGPLAGIADPLTDAVKNKLSDPLTAAVSRYYRELPQSVQDRVNDLPSLQAAVLANRTKRALAGAAGLPGKLANTADLEDTILRYPELFEHGIPSEISSQHGHQLGYQAQNAADLIKDGQDETRLNFAPTMKVGPNGNYKEYLGGDDGFMSAWMKQLDDVASSSNTHLILKNIDEDTTTLRQKVADFLQSDEYKPKWDMAARSERLSDGRVVGTDATEREAALDWADHLITHVQQLLRDRDGNLHENVYSDLMKNGSISDMRTLMNVPKEVRPDSVVGPEFVQLPGGKAEGIIREFTERGFARMGRAIDYMSRQPMYVTAVHKADADIRPFIERQFGEGTAMSKEITTALVRERANAETLPYIHNPRIRSQMNILTQNIAPFQFAQEQFWKRWAKTFTQSPEAIREIQMAHHALGASGFTHVDDSGQEIFTYPGTGFVQKALADGFSALNIPAALPVVDKFTGQINMVAPGLDRTFAPSVGPFVSIPLSFATRYVKELQPVTSKVLGPQGQNKALWEQYVPASVARVINATIANDQMSPSYANAQMKTIQDLYATGHGLDPNANAEDQEKFMRRVKNYTRINMFGKALLGFGAPAAPQSVIGDTKFGEQLRTLSNAGLNYSAAMQQMVKDNPDMYPYSVFMSKGAGDEPLPSTTAAAQALESNRGFFTAFPKASGFFLPETTSNDTFSDAAYKDQLNEEMRKRLMPQDFLNQLMYNQAAGTYFDTRDDYTAQTKNLTGAAKTQITQNYQAWKAQFLAEHPTFGDMLQNATAVTKRADTLDEVQRALNDHRLPDTPQTDDIRTLVDTYSLLQNDLSQFKGLSTSYATKQRQTLTANFISWYKNTYLAAHPNGATLYNSLLKPDLEGNQ